MQQAFLAVASGILLQLAVIDFLFVKVFVFCQFCSTLFQTVDKCLAHVDELQINAEISGLKQLDNSLQVILFRTGNTYLVILNLSSYLQLGSFDSCHDFFCRSLWKYPVGFPEIGERCLWQRAQSCPEPGNAEEYRV